MNYFRLSDPMKDLLAQMLGGARSRPGRVLAALQRRGLADDAGKLTREGRVEAKRLKQELEDDRQARPSLDSRLWATQLPPMPPPPPPPTPEQIRQREEQEALLAELDDLHAVFNPRGGWYTPSVLSDSGVLRALVLLRELMTHHEVLLNTRPLAHNQTARSRWLWQRFGEDSPELHALARCEGRRGQEDLKDQTWSAYRHLRRTLPGESLELAYDFPACWLAQASHTAVTAGNVDVLRALRFVAEQKVRTFGIVGSPAWDPYDGWHRAFHWELTTLSFSPRALDILGAAVGADNDAA